MQILTPARPVSVPITCAALALLLGACGGGGSGSTAAGEDMAGSAVGQEAFADATQGSSGSAGSEELPGTAGSQAAGGDGDSEEAEEEAAGSQEAADLGDSEEDAGEREPTGSDDREGPEIETRPSLDGVTIDAGPDRGALEGSTIGLDVGVSGAPDGAAVQLRWTRQDDGETNTDVTLPVAVAGDERAFELELPLVDADTSLVFLLEVDVTITTDAEGNPLFPARSIALSDVVDVTVQDGLPSSGAIVAAVSRPVAGVPEATLADVGETVLAPDGTVVFTGEFSLGNGREHGLWRARSGVVELVARTGDAMAGLPANVRFERAASLSVATDGEIGALVTVQGAGGGTAAMLTEDGVPRIVLRNGVAAPSGSFPATVARIEYVERTDRGLYVGASGGRNVEGLWEWADGAWSTVNLSIAAARGSSSRPRTDDGCLIVASSRLRANRRGQAAYVATLVTPGFLELSSGSLPTGDAVGCDREPGALQGVLVRYANGEHEELLAPKPIETGPRQLAGIELPGLDAVSFTLRNVLWLQEDGAALVRADASLPGSPDNPTGIRSESVLRVGSAGADGVDLLALSGETLPPGFVDRFADLEDALFSRPSGGGMTLLVGVGGEVSILRGAGREGQPYTSLANAGAAQFDYVVSTLGAGPSGFADSAFFERIGLPAIDAEGDVYFAGGIADSTDSDFALEGVWRAGVAGPIELAIASDAPVQFASRQLRLRSLDLRAFSNSSAAGANSVPDVQTSDDGTVMVRGTVEFDAAFDRDPDDPAATGASGRSAEAIVLVPGR